MNGLVFISLGGCFTFLLIEAVTVIAIVEIRSADRSLNYKMVNSVGSDVLFN